jgi:hypothetical protein
MPSIDTPESGPASMDEGDTVAGVASTASPADQASGMDTNGGEEHQPEEEVDEFGNALIAQPFDDIRMRAGEEVVFDTMIVPPTGAGDEGVVTTESQKPKIQKIKP